MKARQQAGPPRVAPYFFLSGPCFFIFLFFIFFCFFAFFSFFGLFVCCCCFLLLFFWGGRGWVVVLPGMLPLKGYY